MEGSPANESEEQSYIKVHEIVFKLKAIHDRVTKTPLISLLEITVY